EIPDDNEISEVKQNMLNKIAELSKDLTPENIKLIEILTNGLKML
ncbi:TPA: RepB family plasmid replication initiator protein, partial [Klebsiella pneumoniae]